MYINILNALTLFPPWLATNWTPQDDSAFGGLSHSTLTAIPGAANFSGTVTFSPASDAAYASVNTAPSTPYDWSGYECGGIEVDVKVPIGNKKKFAVLLWNRVPSLTDRSKKNWFEHDFVPKGKGGYETVFLPFADFKPYDTEGKAIVVDPPTLQLEGVRWLNFMVRTYYGEKEQAGPFWLGVKKVRVVDVKGKAKCLVKY